MIARMSNTIIHTNAFDYWIPSYGLVCAWYVNKQEVMTSNILLHCLHGHFLFTWMEMHLNCPFIIKASYQYVLPVKICLSEK